MSPARGGDLLGPMLCSAEAELKPRAPASMLKQHASMLRLILHVCGLSFLVQFFLSDITDD